LVYLVATAGKALVLGPDNVRWHPIEFPGHLGILPLTFTMISATSLKKMWFYPILILINASKETIHSNYLYPNDICTISHYISLFAHSVPTIYHSITIYIQVYIPIISNYGLLQFLKFVITKNMAW
jgi:hypothetical protein